MNIVNVGYDSTNYYVLADNSPKLLIDIGWPGTLPKLQYQCKRVGIDLSAIKHLLCTHYHPDHAGLAQELKHTGCKLVVLEHQLPAIPTLATYMKPQNNYIEIALTDNIVVNLDDSRSFLAKLGIQGEIISTPAHSEDSITLILDEGAAFTGDLTNPLLIVEENMELVQGNWERVRSYGAKTVYPGHGPTWRLG